MTVAFGVVAAAIGIVVGIAELANRFRSEPTAALTSLPGILYLTINGAAATGVYVVAVALDWQFGLPSNANDQAVAVTRALVAGFGAVAILRTSLFVFVQGTETIDVGPAGVLDSIRGAVDRAIERRQATSLLQRDLLAGLSFVADHEALTLLCSAALERPDSTSAEQLGVLAAQLKAESSMADPIKLHTYAMELARYVGRPALEQAAKRLRSVRPVSDSPGSTEVSDYGDAISRADAMQMALEANANEDRIDLRISLWLAISDTFLEARRPDLAAHAYTRLGEDCGSLSDAAYAADALFGAGTVLSQDRNHVRWRLTSLLSRRFSHTLTGVGFLSQRREVTFASWVYGTALYELWPHIDTRVPTTGPDLLEDVLSTSIRFANLWDVRLARAASRVRNGDYTGGREDLEVAIHLQQSGSLVQAVGFSEFRLLLKLLRDLLTPELPQSARLTIEESAFGMWQRHEKATHRSWAIAHLGTPTEPRKGGADDRITRLFAGVAAAVPRRVPVYPVANSFIAPSDGARPPEELLSRLETLAVKPNKPDTSWMPLGEGLLSRSVKAPKQ